MYLMPFFFIQYFFYILLNLRTLQTQNFLIFEISWAVPEIFEKKKKFLKVKHSEIGTFRDTVA